MAGDTVGGIVSDTILKRTGRLVLARSWVIAAGLLGAAAFLMPLLFVRDLTTVTFCLTAAFFCAELVVAPIWAVPMDIVPRHAGTASGMMNFGFGVAGLQQPRKQVTAHHPIFCHFSTPLPDDRPDRTAQLPGGAAHLQRARMRQPLRKIENRIG